MENLLARFMQWPRNDFALAAATRLVLLAWAESGGFAATHGAGATSEAIVEDLLGFLKREGWALVPRQRPPGP